MNAVTPDELATQVLEDSGYFEMLKMDKSVEAPGRIENLKELISVMGDTEKYPTLADFLEHVSLVMDNDDALDTNKVMLITLHSAKGLEFDVVFLPGWEEGLFHTSARWTKAAPKLWRKNAGWLMSPLPARADSVIF